MSDDNFLKFDPISRRSVILGLGGFALSIPLLPSLLPRAFAQTASDPELRLLQIFHQYGRPWEGNGDGRPLWFPGNKPTTKVAENVYVTRLTELPDPMSYLLGSHFNPVRSKMNIIRGLDYLAEVTGHNACGPTTAASNFYEYVSGQNENRLDTCVFPYSIEQILAESSKVYSPTVSSSQRVIRVYPHNVRPTKVQSGSQSFSWRSLDGTVNNSERLYGQWDAGVVFNELFGGGTQQAPPVAQQRRQLASDLVLEQFDRVKNGRRIAQEDKVKLENYMDLVHELQKRIEEVNVCTKPTLDPYGSSTSSVVAYKNHTDLIIAAMLCGKTRLAQIMIHHQTTAPQQMDDYHNSAHFDLPRFIEYSLFQSQRVADILIAMDSHTESNGKTLLDNSIVYWSSDHADSAAHGPQSIPMVTAGSGGGKFQVGYYIDYVQRQRHSDVDKVRYPIGRPYNNFLITLFKAFGVGPEEYQKFGVNGFGQYGVLKRDRLQNDLTVYDQFTSTTAARHAALPFFYKG